MMLTDRFTRRPLGKGGRGGWLITSVNGEPTPCHLAKVRIPPAWIRVQVDPSPEVHMVAVGYDAAGRKQRLYSAVHNASSQDAKFRKVAKLLSEWEDIRSQIEIDLNKRVEPNTTEHDAALVAYLIYETGIRPGGFEDGVSQARAFGATTLQLRHVKPCTRGVRLKFVGKKGVRQNVLVTNPYLVRIFKKRKRATTAYTTALFDVSVGYLRRYFKSLGSGIYSPKDFRTARGTSLALELLGDRQRLPRSLARRKRVVNRALDRVARTLGNTRAVSRSAYVDPAIVEKFTL